MTEAVFQFKLIRQKLERQDQKAEFEEKNPKVEPSMYGWPYGVAVPFEDPRPVSVTFAEGGEWVPVQPSFALADVHSIRFSNGAEWDIINGWRTKI